MTFIDNNTMSHDINFRERQQCDTPCGLSPQTGGKFIILRNVRRKATQKMLPAKLICTQQFYTILFAFEFQLFSFSSSAFCKYSLSFFQHIRNLLIHWHRNMVLLAHADHLIYEPIDL